MPNAPQRSENPEVRFYMNLHVLKFTCGTNLFLLANLFLTWLTFNHARMWRLTRRFKVPHPSHPPPRPIGIGVVELLAPVARKGPTIVSIFGVLK